MAKKVGVKPNKTNDNVTIVDKQNVVRTPLTKLEKQARREARAVRMASYGDMGNSSSMSVTQADQNFYSPQLSTDFLELPQSEREKRELLRFWYVTDPIVGAAIDFHTDVPMSKIRLSSPKGKDTKRNKQILHFFEKMCKRVRLFQTLYDVTHEYWLHGNCVEENSPIRIPGGYIPAKDLDVGDLVLTHLGRWRKILAVSSRWSDDSIRIDMWKTNRFLHLTEEHPVEVYRDGRFQFVLAGDINAKDYIRVTWPKEVNDVSIVSLEKEIVIDSDLLYTIGYWLGCDSETSESGLWHVAFGQKSSLQLNKILGYLRRVFGDESVLQWVDAKNITCLHVSSNSVFAEWWSEQFGGTDSLKRVPNWILELPDDKLSFVVSGLIDSDGCIGRTEKGHMTFSVSSKYIHDFMRDACLRLGAVVNDFSELSRLTKLPTGEEVLTKEMHTIQCLDEESCLILTKNCLKKPIEGQKYPGYSPFFIRVGKDVAFKVRRISNEDGCNVINFEVEEDHTYQVNGFSTHNCYIFCEDHDLTSEIPEELFEIGDRPDEVSTGNLRPEGYEKILDERSKKIQKFVQERYQGWQRLQILPPEQVKLEIFQYTSRVQMELIPSEKDRLVVMKALEQNDTEAQRIADDIPEQIRENLLSGQPIPLNTSPYDDFLCSSFCYHLAHKRSPYDDRGVSILERCLRTLLFRDKLRQSQTSIASRAMTPKRVIWGDKMSQVDVDDLRDQIDQALVDPDYSIITNYEVHWDEIGARDRLLDLSNEYETTNKLLFIGLRMTESMLTGESTFSGERIHLDVMNTMYLLYRETISEFVEQLLFAPVAEKKGFWEEDEYGNKNLLFPKLQFTRLALRDNTEMQDFMFNLYQKGSMPIDYIYELLNIDSEDAHALLKRDLFTPKDATFNEIIRNMYSKVGDNLAEKSDAMNKVAENVGLRIIEDSGDRFGKE